MRKMQVISLSENSYCERGYRILNAIENEENLLLDSGV